MGIFETRYDETAEGRDERRKGLTKKSLVRAFESGIDSLEDQIIEVEQSIEVLTDKIVKEEYKSGIRQLLEKESILKELKQTATDLLDLQSRFFDKA